jgi:hypothetical protein
MRDRGAFVLFGPHQIEQRLSGVLPLQHPSSGLEHLTGAWNVQIEPAHEAHRAGQRRETRRTKRRVDELTG